MFKLQFLILFIIVVPNLSDTEENEMNPQEMMKCIDPMSLLTKTDTADKCISRTSLLIKGKNETKCCFLTLKPDPLAEYKKKYRENWKKIVSQINGYDLNISEEEIRNKLNQNVEEINTCQLVMKNATNIILYSFSYSTVEGVVKYDCGEGQKIFKKNEFHPKNRDEIIQKEMYDARFLFTEKDCLKKGTKFSSDEYQVCWCEEIPLSFGKSNEKNCIAFKISLLKKQLKKEMVEIQKKYPLYSKIEYKCTCSNNKGKMTKASINSATGEVKVE
jgi:hypothetical protein